MDRGSASLLTRWRLPHFSWPSPASFLVWGHVSPIPLPPDRARAWHCTTRLDDDDVLTRTPGELRDVVRSVLRHGQPAGLLCFAVIDTHLHVLLCGRRADAGEAMRRIELACHRLLLLDRRFQGARIRPVEDQLHLTNTVHYILRQPLHHAVAGDGLNEGSAIHDLLGLRVPGLPLPGVLLTELPRMRVAELLPHLGLSSDELTGWDFPLTEAELPWLLDSAAAAFAVRDMLRRSKHCASLRAAMVRAVGDEVATGRIAAHTGLARSSICRLRARPVDAAWVRCVRRQVRLRIAVTLRRDAEPLGMSPESAR